jgi:poly(A) polymerase
MIEAPDSKEFRAARAVVRRLAEAGHRALLAGGCVRDLVLGRRPKDYDVATGARPEQVRELFERVWFVGRSFGVCQVLQDGEPIEVATFRRESDYRDGRRPEQVEFCDAEEDARRRDFTINGMFWDPLAGEVIDYVGGRADLDAGVLRAVGEPAQRFQEDHLRLLRAVRFASRLDLSIEEATRAAIVERADLVDAVAAERVQQELRTMLTDEHPARALRLMDELGLLRYVLPEVDAMHGVEQPENYHPEGDVFVHTMLAVEKLAPYPDFALAMATLLHDVGKPVAVREAGEPMVFRGHDTIGRDLAERICRRLRMPNAEAERVSWLVGRHHYFMNAEHMRDSTYRKLFAEPGFDQLAALHRADALASWGCLEDYSRVMARRQELPRREEDLLPEPLVTGHDLIEMGFEPGPMFGEVLDEVRDAQLDEEVTTREEALKLAREKHEEKLRSQK